ncbi:MAG: right-handed parallel beta-helix repeat-containing protein [Phycisphaerales bacterium]
MHSALRCLPSCAIAALTLLPSVAAASGLNFVSGEIVADTTWIAADSPYTVVDDVIVRAGATLTIEPGVIVRFRPDTRLIVGPYLDDDGTLHAVGTADDAILFTSDFIKPAPGSWRGIQFGYGLNGAIFDADGTFISGSVLGHAEVWFAGEADTPGIVVQASNPWFHDTLVTENAATGVVIEDGDDVRFDRCRFVRNGRVHPAVIGGALRIEGGEDAILSQCAFLDNRAWEGGAVHIDAHNARIERSLMQGNVAEVDGGGLWLRGPGHRVTETRFDSNVARGVGGGFRALDVPGLRVLDCDVAGNTGRNGGGAHIEGGNKALVRGGTWSGNLAEGSITAGPSEDIKPVLQHGGGAIVIAADDTSIEDAIFRHNRAIGNHVGGGAVLMTGSAQNLLIDSCSMTHNVAGQAGGAIAMGPDSFAVEIRGCSIRHNAVNSGSGGGVWVDADHATITDTSIEANTASVAGGGLWTRGLSTEVLTSRIRHNEAGLEGGGIAWLGAAGSLSGLPDSPNCVSENVAPIGAALMTGTETDAKTPLPARFVYWGTSLTLEIEADIHHRVDAPELRLVDYADAIAEDPCPDRMGPCAADLDGNQTVDFADLLVVIGAFGTSAAGDVTGDGQTDLDDLITMLAAWGACSDD